MNIRQKPELSVIVPVGERHADAEALYAEYARALRALGRPYELTFVLDGPRPAFRRGLERLHAAGERFTVVGLTRPFGEATALMAAFAHSTAPIVLTLPAYHQIEPDDVGRLVAAVGRSDVVIGHRSPRAGGALESLRRRLYHGLLGRVTRVQLRDVACGARAFRREVLEEIALYGDQHRFLPYLADRHGFSVVEVDVRQSPRDRNERGYAPQEYLRSLLDIFSVFFLVRFTKKPLRFFGMVGVTTAGIGVLWALLLIAERQFLGQPLGDRPALLLASLLIVLGTQVFALGLLGELIIFTHARTLKDYHIAEVTQFTRPTLVEPAAPPRSRGTTTP